jgi:ribonuclease HI
MQPLQSETSSLKHIIIYTDGACSGNPGPGGWGVVLIYKDTIKEISGSDPQTTNNRMELMAAIQGLTALTTRCRVDIYTDSSYVKDGITKWIHNWKKNNWCGSDKKPVKNIDLWEQLDELVPQHDTSWHWVRGHNGDRFNTQADQLAVNACKAQISH